MFPFFFFLVGGDSFSSGSVISVHDLDEGEIFVPPPPTSAPPPPPGAFVLPPPDFMGELNGPVPQFSPPMVEEDFSSLKPPSMVPPKPPSVCSSGSASSLTLSGSSNTVPEPPRYKPPEPPSQKQNKTSKAPPPKPIRLSSMTNLIDSPPETPAPPPPVQTPTLSTFNPQSPAKIYTMPKPSFLGNFEKHEQRPKQMLLLEDSGSVKPNPVLVQVNGNKSNVVSQPKPVSKDVQELKEHVDRPNHSPSPLPKPKKELKTGPLSPSVENGKPPQTLNQTSPQLQKPKSFGVTPESSKDELSQSPSQVHRFSSLLDRKLHNLKTHEKNAAREGHAASPLALLMAAKERDKHKSNPVLSQENGYKNNYQLKASIQPSDSTAKSSAVTPRSISSPSLTAQNILQENSMYASVVKPIKIQSPTQSGSPALVKDQVLPSGPDRMAKSKSTSNLVTQLQSTLQEDGKEDLNIPLLPPPPEFDDLDEEVEPPPSILPPDPPTQKAPTQNKYLKSLAQHPLPSPKPKLPQAPKVSSPELPKIPHLEAPKPKLPPAPKISPLEPPELSKPKVSQAPKPSPPQAPKFQIPQAPKLPAPLSNPKPLVQTKPKVAFAQQPSALSPSQATLLSILQKKMLEMDPKMASDKEPESNSDDWGSPSYDESNGVPVIPRATTLGKNKPAVNKAAALDMKELEGRMVKKSKETPSLRSPTR